MKTKTSNPALMMTVACGLACSVTAFAQMPNHSITRIDWLQRQGQTGLGIWIGQMETGIANNEHTAYATRIVRQEDGGTVTEHATEVAGIMLAGAQVYNGNNYTGIATRSRLMSSYNGGGSPGHYTAGMNWLVDRPIEIINISWGGEASTSMVDPDTIVADWAAHSRGKLVVAVAGNGRNGRPPVSPGDGFNVLTVGATGVGRTDGTVDYRRLATYSNSGLTGGHPSMSGRAKIDLVAPGTDIVTTLMEDINRNRMRDDWGVAGEGTSYAAPHVSGTAALVMEESIGKPWESSGKDPRVMRAVLINSVQERLRPEQPTLGRPQVLEGCQRSRYRHGCWATRCSTVI
jgi:subtilisin family serine protease